MAAFVRKSFSQKGLKAIVFLGVDPILRLMTIGKHDSVVRAAGLYDCAKRKELEVGGHNDEASLKATYDHDVTRAGYTLVSSVVVRYSDVEEHGLTYLAAIGESAIDIHTWPEKGTALLTVHTCGNEKKCEESFQKLLKTLTQRFGSKQAVVFDSIQRPLSHSPVKIKMFASA